MCVFCCARKMLPVAGSIVTWRKCASFEFGPPMNCFGSTSPFARRSKTKMPTFSPFPFRLAATITFRIGSTSRPTMSSRPVFGPVMTRFGATLPFAVRSKTTTARMLGSAVRISLLTGSTATVCGRTRRVRVPWIARSGGTSPVASALNTSTAPPSATGMTISSWIAS